MTELKLELEVGGKGYEEVFGILREFLQPESKATVESVVDSLVDILEDGFTKTRPINGVCILLAEQIPYWHPSHIKLAQIIWLLGRSTKRMEKQRIEFKHRTISFAALFSRTSTVPPEAANAAVNFYALLADDIVNEDILPDMEAVPPEAYANLQAFLANLHAMGVYNPDSGDAPRTMRDAFEGDHSKETPAVRDAWYLGAAQWILWYGQGLFRATMWNDEANGNKETDFYVMTPEKWKNWKDGFADVAGSEWAGEELKSVSDRVVHLMEGIEKGMGFH